jgi:hypothetical protein
MSEPGFEGAIVALPPVSLDEVLDAAELQTRVDRKYIVSVGQLDMLVPSAGAAVLEIDGLRQFGYETAYFDTPDRRLYLDTAYRRPRRFNVRVRTYLDSNSSMFEVKRKDGRGRTDKDRLDLDSGRDRRRLDTEMRTFVDSSVATDVTDRLQEAAITRFDRTTLVDIRHHARYTIDHRLTSTSPDGRTVKLRNAVVVECKSAGRATPMDRALWDVGVRPARISKYCTTLALLEPSLPANHWHRTLKRHFGAAAAS